MMAEVREALDGCELVLLIVDVTRKFAQADQLRARYGQEVEHAGVSSA